MCYDKNIVFHDKGGNKMQKPILVLGHRNPDTDSICSAIAYAYMKQQLGENVVAARAGKVNPETAFVLDYFGAAAPQLVDDLYPRLGDSSFVQPPVAAPQTSLRDLGRLFVEQRPKAIPLLHPDGSVAGLITVNDLAMRYYDELSIQDLDDAEVNFHSIVATLEGTLLCGEVTQVFHGNIRIGASHVDTLTSALNPGDLIIVGDREEVQLAALKGGAVGLVLTRQTVPSAAVLALAQAQHALLINTAYDTYTTVRLIHQSIPACFIMQKNFLAFKTTDLVADVKKQIMNSEATAFPVLEWGKYVGMVDRGSLLTSVPQEVILVDHNERSQAVEGIEHAKLLEIIDHHRLGGLTTGNPIFIRQEPVGSTATIVANLTWHRQVQMTPTIAGLLLAAIISDTLYFKSPTATAFDRTTAAELAKQAGISQLETFALAVLRAGSLLNNMPAEEIVRNDVKEFDLAVGKVTVGQVTVMDGAQAADKLPELLAALQALVDSGACALALLMVTDIMAATTELLCAGSQQHLLDPAFGTQVTGGHYHLPGVLSRKKQIIPPLTEVLR